MLKRTPTSLAISATLILRVFPQNARFDILAIFFILMEQFHESVRVYHMHGRVVYDILFYEEISPLFCMDMPLGNIFIDLFALRPNFYQW